MEQERAEPGQTAGPGRWRPRSPGAARKGADHLAGDGFPVVLLCFKTLRFEGLNHEGPIYCGLDLCFGTLILKFTAELG